MKTEQEWLDENPALKILNGQRELIRAIQQDAIESAAKAVKENECGRPNGGCHVRDEEIIRALLPANTTKEQPIELTIREEKK